MIPLSKIVSAVCGISAVLCLLYIYAASKVYKWTKVDVEGSGEYFRPSGTPAVNESRPILDQAGGKKAIRILCWIKTHPNNIKTKAAAIKDTWASRCDKTLFMSSTADPELPAVGLNTTEGRAFLTDKVMRAFHYVYEHYLHEYDWFFTADDDTYVIVENLRRFLSDKNPEVPIYYGHHFHTIVEQGYSSGGSGYVLSREALRRLGKYGYDPILKCELIGGADDVEIGACLQRLNVPIGDSRDDEGRSRFHCFDPSTHINGEYPDWYFKYDTHGAKKNFLSDYAISFHYVTPDMMRTLDYLIYHLRPSTSSKDEILKLFKNKARDQNDEYSKSAEESSARIIDVIT